MNENTARLADYNIDELEEWLSNACPELNARASYRGAQIFRWLGLGSQSFDEMTNLPLDLRAALASRSSTGIPAIIAAARSNLDGTVKYAMETDDGCVVESVLMKYRHGDAVCVSTQAGCRMGCSFCATKPQNYSRNLTAGEIFGQVVSITKHNEQSIRSEQSNRSDQFDRSIQSPRSGKRPPRIGNIVVMGIGEPFDNYDNTLKFIRLLHEHGETNIGYRKITISTCGILPGILKLAEESLPIGLAVSLHAPNDKIRSLLMPVNRRYSIDKLIEGCKIYTYKTNRRVTFEYALIKGVNDAPDDASELLRLIRGMLCHINLIPVNKTENSEFMPSPKEHIARFESILKKGGAQITVRRGLGTDIMAACGQLRNYMTKQVQ